MFDRRDDGRPTPDESSPIRDGRQKGPEVGGVADPTALVSQLSELRDKGVLTDEQFETQKQRLLDS